MGLKGFDVQWELSYEQNKLNANYNFCNTPLPCFAVEDNSLVAALFGVPVSVSVLN